MSDNPRRTVKDPVKNVDVPVIYSEPVTLPLKTTVPSSKKGPPTSLPPVQQSFKSTPQPFVSPQQHTQTVIYYYNYYYEF